MSALFLFGAGASYGSGDCEPYAPPLGWQLIDRLVEHGGEAASFSPDRLQAFRDDFERAMAEYIKEAHDSGIGLMRDMARYFVQFKPGPENLYRKLIQSIRQSHRRAVLSTTNYDLLIEHAVCEDGHAIDYDTFDTPSRNLTLFKLHGSCNFLPNLRETRTQFRGFSIKGLGLQPNGARVSFLNAGLEAVTPDEVVSFCEIEDAVAPAMSYYAPGKVTPFCPDALDGLVANWRAVLSSANVIYIIGLRVVPDDAHIWQPIASAKGRIEYVGREPDEFLTWADSIGRRNVHARTTTFEEALPLIQLQLRH